jgi:MSHA biogenesis protein MshQ
VITLTATSSDFLNGFGDGSGDSYRIATGTSANLGRFAPDHFDVVTSGTMGCPPSGLTCAASLTPLVYSGQTFNTVSVTAKNTSGNPTQNYNGTFARAVTLSAVSSIGGAAIATGGTGQPTFTPVAVASSLFNAGGVATLTGTALPVYTFATSPTAPTSVYVRAVDTDTPAVSSLLTIAANSVEGGVTVVSGRTLISNANGSELLPMQMTATAQYYNTSGSWVTSTTDNNSTYSTVSNLVASILSTPVTTLTTAKISVKGAGTVTMGNGVSKFTLNAPGVTGKASISLSAPSYLPSTAGISTFGIYSGRKEIVYMRENF